MNGGGFIFLVCPKTLRTLIGLRADTAKWNPNTWFSFGGTIEDTEHPLTTAIREMHEETGITNDAYDIFKDPLFKMKTVSDDGITHTLFLYLGIMPDETIPHINDEAKQWKWCNLSELSSLNTHPALSEMFTNKTSINNLKLTLKNYL